MNLSEIAERYAKSLFNIVKEDVAEAKKLLTSLNTLLELFDLEESKNILENMVMPKDLKQKLLIYASEKTDHAELLKSFIGVVLESNRVEYIPDIVKSFKILINRKESLADALVTSAFVLEEPEMKDIKQYVENKINKKVNITSKIDPELIAGFKVEVEGYILESSLKSRIDDLTKVAMS